MFKSGFNQKKFKVNLKLVISRLKLIEKKKTELAMKERKEIAEYLKLNKYDRARIRVEHIIREDYLVEAMEIVEMYADILHARLGLMTSSKCLDESLKKPVSSLLWVALRMSNDVNELKVIHDQLTAYYGKEYAHACHSNAIGTVCERMMAKLSPNPPARKLVEMYLIEIARAANIDFTPDEDALREEVGIPPATLTEEELISFYDSKNVQPGGGPPPPGNYGGPPGNFGGPPNGGAGGGSGNYYYPQGAASAPPPNQVPAGAATLPPYTPTDPNSQNSSIDPQYAMATDEPQAPPLPTKNPAGTPEKRDLSNDDRGVSASNYLKPDVPIQPPVAAPRSASPGIPDLPSVPSSFATPQQPDDNNDVDFDDLTKRFENLKKKK